MSNQKDLSKLYEIEALSEGFRQLVLFTTTIKEKKPSGLASSINTEREVEIIYLGFFDYQHKYQVFLYKTEILLERKAEPDLVLIRRLSYVFDELVLGVNFEGSITELVNFSFIRYRWSQIRTALIQEYYDEKFQHYFSFLDELIADYWKVMEYIKSPSMYGLYFNGYRKKYECDKPELALVKYGEEANNLEAAETRTFHLKESETCKLVKLKIAAVPDGDNPYKIKGECRYLDGVLEHYHKEVSLDTKKIIYTAKWVGLKKYFQ